MMSNYLHKEAAMFLYIIKEGILLWPISQLVENVGFFLLGLGIRDTLAQETALNRHRNAKEARSVERLRFRLSF